MRQYAWYSPGLDTIVLQTIMDSCVINFEWDPEVLVIMYQYGINNPMKNTGWIPLGEL